MVSIGVAMLPAHKGAAVELLRVFGCRPCARLGTYDRCLGYVSTFLNVGLQDLPSEFASSSTSNSTASAWRTVCPPGRFQSCVVGCVSILRGQTPSTLFGIRVANKTELHGVRLENRSPTWALSVVHLGTVTRPEP
jgi:hypothetical protein